MEDEDFGEDVLVTTQRGGAGVKEEAKTEESRATWEAGQPAPVKAEKPGDDEDEDEDEELYGGVSIQLNASATSQAEAAAASAAAGHVPAGGKAGDDPAADSDEDEDDEDVAIVLSTDHAGSKPTLRFTGGGNRYVRGSFGGAQHGGPGAAGAGAAGASQAGELGGSAADGVDDLAMFGGRRTAFDVDIDLLEDRPWRKPGVDISDYFNYGFDEHSWREYAARQLRLRRELAVEKSREQASRQAVSAANQQQAMRERDAKMQGGPRGVPGQMKQEGGDDQNGGRPGDWGPGMPPMGGAPPRGGFMGGPPPRGWHPGMGPPPGFMGQQNWNGPPMGAPWGSGPGRGPPWMGGPGDGRVAAGRERRVATAQDPGIAHAEMNREAVDVGTVLEAKMPTRRTKVATETESVGATVMLDETATLGVTAMLDETAMLVVIVIATEVENEIVLVVLGNATVIVAAIEIVTVLADVIAMPVAIETGGALESAKVVEDVELEAIRRKSEAAETGESEVGARGPGA
ncbi:putative pre-mRNA polyadenylation factor [Phytophthora cinnamomi]|uniref:putative pre-mRNA polyadenylation factor n=1 Tax=Phytophthora cinnamomi TaxID=4785 RepID=UPI00355A215A|nr:putative pre-mRNA polyadenylation factor [Phytophthora cinnamomi]